MNAIESFKQAAKDFQTDGIYLRFQEAKKANDADKELQDNLGEFSLVRLDLNNEMAKTDKDDARVTELNSKINTLYNDIMSNKNMMAYSIAKEEVQDFMNYVNTIMNATLEGQDPLLVEKPTAECGSDCSSCGGGCG